MRLIFSRPERVDGKAAGPWARNEGGTMLKDFKAFILRGNVVDLAVGIVIGAAFTAVVTSFVANLLTPLISIPGKTNFSALYVHGGRQDVPIRGLRERPDRLPARRGGGVLHRGPALERPDGPAPGRRGDRTRVPGTAPSA